MEKKTIIIPNQIVKSILIGFTLSILLIIFLHISGSFGGEPYRDYYKESLSRERNSESNSKNLMPVEIDKNAPVYKFILECKLDKRHTFDGNGITFYQLFNETFNFHKIKASIIASFENHSSEIIKYGIIFSVIISILLRFRFKIN